MDLGDHLRALLSQVGLLSVIGMRSAEIDSSKENRTFNQAIKLVVTSPPVTVANGLRSGVEAD